MTVSQVRVDSLKVVRQGVRKIVAEVSQNEAHTIPDAGAFAQSAVHDAVDNAKIEQTDKDVFLRGLADPESVDDYIRASLQASVKMVKGAISTQKALAKWYAKEQIEEYELAKMHGQL